MTGKRFTWLKKDVYAPQIVITDSLTEKDLTPTDCYELLNELAEENESLNSNLDDAIEQISKLHSRISELSRELKNKSEEHRENDFKLQTLEKWYTCPHCAFSGREFEYLQSLRRIE